MTATSLIGASLLAPGGYFLLHGALARSLKGTGLPAQKIAIIACAAGCSLQTYGWLAGLGVSRGSIGFTLFSSLCTAHVYFHFFNMSETARRIRFLVAHYRNPSYSESLERPDQKTAIRLRRLVELGAVVREENRYRIQSGLFSGIARILVAYERWIFPERFRSQG